MQMTITNHAVGTMFVGGFLGMSGMLIPMLATRESPLWWIAYIPVMVVGVAAMLTITSNLESKILEAYEEYDDSDTDN